MLTEENITSLGYKHVGSYSNGGTKTYQLNKKSYHVIDYNGDNFVYKKENSSKLSLIKIMSFDRATGFTLRYAGHPATVEHLIEVLKSLNLQQYDRERVS